MSSEHRLHPYSILFAFLTQIRLFVVPGLLLAVGVSSRGNDWWDWQPWMMLLIVPNALFALVRYLTYTYRFDERDLVIRSGLIFRRERHIPYARIQSIDAVQNVLHRIFDVAEVKLETGGGDAAEATMQVLPLSAFRAMRERVFSGRDALRADEPAPKPPSALVSLDLREVMLCGFLENRGGVLIAAILGAIWQSGLLDRAAGSVFGGAEIGRGAFRSLFRAIVSNATVSWGHFAWAIGSVFALLLIVRVASMVWAVFRLYGFTATEVDDDVRREFGLLTRVALTTPRRRIQALTVREGPLHRYCGRVAVKVDTAGGREKEEQQRTDREYLAPILRREALPDFVNSVVGVDLRRVAWNPPDRRAIQREVKPWLILALFISAGVAYVFGWWALAVAPLLLVWAVIVARQNIKHLRWSESSEAVLLTHGWLWRRIVIVRLAKMQVVTRHESPFDRRHAMASVHVDTAGATEGSVVNIPYLSLPDADALHARLASAAAGTQFKW